MRARETITVSRLTWGTSSLSSSSAFEARLPLPYLSSQATMAPLGLSQLDLLCCGGLAMTCLGTSCGAQ